MNTNADAVPSLLEPTPMKEGQFGDKEPEFRMDAYYYGFAPTGLLVIDRILSAVACAGKSFHHTDCWTDQCTPYDHLRGETVTDWIQNAANDAADAIRRAPASKVQADHIADEPVEQFLSEVRAELIRARRKFPGDRIMTIALAEEFGELCKAVLDESAANVRKEAVQTAVMCARVVLDGDGSVISWRAERGLDALVSPASSTGNQEEK